MSVQMELAKIIISEMADQQVIVLKEVDGERNFAIVIGPQEAWAIDRRLKGHATPRPMTHDLLKNVLLGLDVQVRKIVVNDLRDDTFFALIWVEREGELISIDSRPSDALALALRVDCPIFVDEAVLKNSKVTTALAERSSNEQLRNYLEGLSDEDLGRYKM